MPISFGSSEGSGNSLFIRSNLPQNRWWVKTDAGDENIDMSRGFAVDISRVQFGWLPIDIGVICQNTGTAVAIRMPPSMPAMSPTIISSATSMVAR